MHTTPPDSATTKLHSIFDLMQMMGDVATLDEAILMRDTLMQRGQLTWASNSEGGLLADISDDEWLDAIRTAIGEVRQ